MLILKQAHYLAISFLSATAGTTLALGMVAVLPQAASYGITKLAIKALKESKISSEVVPPIKALLIIISVSSVVGSFVILGLLLGSIFSISVAASFLVNQKELDKASEFNKFVNNKT